MKKTQAQRQQGQQGRASHTPAAIRRGGQPTAQLFEFPGAAQAKRDVSVTLNTASAQLKQQQSVKSLQDNPRTLAQRVSQQAMLQRKLQEASHTAQKVEDEELMQGKFDTAQKVEEEELMQGKFDTAQLVEEEELMQGKSATQLREDSDQAAANDTGLPDNVKAGIESMSGMSMDHVKVHYNSDKPAQLNALAYAQGSDIHVSPGQEQHVPHEAWHIVQQAQGRVNPTMQAEDGTQINDDNSLETEADTMGAKAAQFKPDRKSHKH